jgi:acetyl esterase/lipase
MPTPVDYTTDPHLTEGVRAFLNTVNQGPSPEMLPISEARQVLVDAQANVKVDLSGISTSEKTITHLGHTIKLNIVRPEKAKGVLPVFIFVHGGGWVLGDFPTHQRMVRDLVVLSDCAAVFVNYTLSPEAHYPQALDEIFAATDWVAQHGEEISVDGKNMAIAGNSAGGNLAAVTTIRAKENGGPHIKLQILMWPATNDDFNTGSYQMYGEGRFLTVPLMKWSYDQYTTNQKERDSIYVSPLHATVEQLRGLPTCLIQVAENDILRDDGLFVQAAAELVRHLTP